MNDLQSLITEMTVVGSGVLSGERTMPEFMQALRACLRAAAEAEPLICNVLFFTEERFASRQAVLSADLLDALAGLRGRVKTGVAASPDVPYHAPVSYIEAFEALSEDLKRRK